MSGARAPRVRPRDLVKQPRGLWPDRWLPHPAGCLSLVLMWELGPLRGAGLGVKGGAVGESRVRVIRGNQDTSCQGRVPASQHLCPASPAGGGAGTAAPGLSPRLLESPSPSALPGPTESGGRGSWRDPRGRLVPLPVLLLLACVGHLALTCVINRFSGLTRCLPPLFSSFPPTGARWWPGC